MSWNQGQQPGNQMRMGGGTGAFQMQQANAYDLTTEDRMAFIRKTYGWLMAALAVAAVAATISFNIFANNIDALMTIMSPFVWLLVMIGGFSLVGFMASRLLMNPNTASGGLFLYAVFEGFIFGPLLVIAYLVAGDAAGTVQVSEAGGVSGGSFDIIWQGLILTGIVFGGLTGYVFLTKQDFSWMRGMLMVAGFAFLGIIVVSLIWGGFGGAGATWISYAIAGFGVLLASGFILYDTSNILHHYSGAPGEEKLAAFKLLADVCLLLWYILYFLIQLQASE